MPSILKILTVVAALIIFTVFYSVIGPQPTPARALTAGIPVGGIFTAGTFDIFTPIVYCGGLEVNVVGPNPGAFIFDPIQGVYSYFPETVEHVSDNMVGLAEPASQCGIPSLVMLGSSAIPGPGE